MDNDNVIDTLERTPTYRRDKHIVEELKNNGLGGSPTVKVADNTQNPKGNSTINFMAD